MRADDQIDWESWSIIRCDEHGATAVEYALLASLIAAIIAGVVGTLGTQVLGMLQQLIGAF